MSLVPHGATSSNVFVLKGFFKEMIYMLSFSLYLCFVLFPEDTDSVSLRIGVRELYDVEMLLIGGFAPLAGFMGSRDYAAVLSNGTLSDGSLWPLPILLPSSFPFPIGEQLILLDEDSGKKVANLRVDEVFHRDFDAELKVLDPRKSCQGGHPFSPFLSYSLEKPLAIGGKLFWASKEKERPVEIHRSNPGVDSFYASPFSSPLPPSSVLPLLRTPSQSEAWLKELNCSYSVAFQTRNPLHYAHIQILRETKEKAARLKKSRNVCVVVHAVIGPTKEGDIPPDDRVRAYHAALAPLERDSIFLSLLPLSMRMAGPREALLHVLVRKNFGFDGFVVGRDHAGARGCYEPLEAQSFLEGLRSGQDGEGGVQGVDLFTFEEMRFDSELGRYVEGGGEGSRYISISGTEVRRRLLENEPLPPWFSPLPVQKVLRKLSPPLKERGTVVLLFGLPASGKSTLAVELRGLLEERAALPVSILDGDSQRRGVSRGLGFAAEDRVENLRRGGLVAFEIVRVGRGVVLAGFIAPSRDSRAAFWEEVKKANSNALSVFLDTPLEERLNRDPKGLYRKLKEAETGGIGERNLPDSSFEFPRVDEVDLWIQAGSARENALLILEKMIEKEFV